MGKNKLSLILLLVTIVFLPGLGFAQQQPPAGLRQIQVLPQIFAPAEVLEPGLYNVWVRIGESAPDVKPGTNQVTPFQGGTWTKYANVDFSHKGEPRHVTIFPDGLHNDTLNFTDFNDPGYGKPGPAEFYLHIDNRSLKDSVTYVFQPLKENKGNSAIGLHGVWRGTYTNSRNQPGSYEISFVEKDGKVEGIADGLRILDGKRDGNTITWRLEENGGIARGGRSWESTVQILDDGDKLIEIYSGHDNERTKYKDDGNYTGKGTLTRKVAQSEQQTNKPSGTLLSGTWQGTYTNSRNEPGSYEISLVEANGRVEGIADGLKILDGKRDGNTITWRLEEGGGVAKGGRSWNSTVQILENGNKLIENYSGHDTEKTKYNDGGNYTGIGTLLKKP